MLGCYPFISKGIIYSSRKEIVVTALYLEPLGGSCETKSHLCRANNMVVVKKLTRA